MIKVDLCSWWGGDRDVANAAWASTYDADKLDKRSDEDVRRVCSSIVANSHQSPKERVWCEFFITCPIFVERQLDKYRLTQQYQNLTIECDYAPMGRENLTQNELSGRYRTIPERFIELPEDVEDIHDAAGRRRDDKEYGFLGREWRLMLESQHRFYQDRLQYLQLARAAGEISPEAYKRAREVIRGVLGTAFLTDMRLICNLGAFEHIAQQRLAETTGNVQVETKEVVRLMLKALVEKQVAPMVVQEMIDKHEWRY